MFILEAGPVDCPPIAHDSHGPGVTMTSVPAISPPGLDQSSPYPRGGDEVGAHAQYILLRVNTKFMNLST